MSLKLAIFLSLHLTCLGCSSSNELQDELKNMEYIVSLCYEAHYFKKLDRIQIGIDTLKVLNEPYVKEYTQAEHEEKRREVVRRMMSEGENLEDLVRELEILQEKYNQSQIQDDKKRVLCTRGQNSGAYCAKAMADMFGALALTSKRPLYSKLAFSYSMISFLGEIKIREYDVKLAVDEYESIKRLAALESWPKELEDRMLHHFKCEVVRVKRRDISRGFLDARLDSLIQCWDLDEGHYPEYDRFIDASYFKLPEDYETSLLDPIYELIGSCCFGWALPPGQKQIHASGAIRSQP